MEVFKEITRVRGDIDRLQRRLKYLSQMTALSTISVALIPDVLAAPVVEPGWQPMAIVKNASRSLINSIKSVIDALIWFVRYLPHLALILVLLALAVRAGFVAIRTWRRRTRRESD